MKLVFKSFLKICETKNKHDSITHIDSSEIHKHPVAEWLRTLIFRALNRSSSHHCGFEPSLGHLSDKPSFGCGWSGVFSRGSPIFAPPND